jgi:small subunit ribosomal protein S1
MNLNQENFSYLFRQSRAALEGLEGSIVEGIIIAIKNNIVIINIGLKMNVKFLKEELFSNFNEIKIGQRLEFYLQEIENREGEIILNYEKAQKQIKFYKIWNILEKKYENKEPVEGKILNYVNGGLSVGIGGIVAFYPGKFVYLGKYLKSFSIVKLNPYKRNIIVKKKKILKHRGL